ncbi:polyketide synthase [Apiospora hydei]|uniref:Polyketide synthase n=1 Tax=Apiospora hydei TaxID=1337664 RepID=A0ABR1X7N5_9PEZI
MDEPIAVIGLDAVFPGDADTADGFYNFILQGRSARTSVPSDRYHAEAYWHPDIERAGAARNSTGHYLKQNVAAFDAPFFSITAEEAGAMDPQQRGVLEGTYRALENAGIPISAAKGTQTGVYVGCFSHDYQGMLQRDIDSRPKYSGLGTSASILSNRVSWFYDLRGPSVTIDTACSSSLVAAHQACLDLQVKETSMAIAAGCNLILSPDSTLELDALGVLSPDGTSYSFDSRANGYGRGEGFGTIVLKRVSDAIRDGNAIRAVIRGSAVNQDGRSPGDFPADQGRPGRADEASFLQHGTGTMIGDPIEASAIAEMFSTHRSKEQPLYVGALKSNIGHLEGAAGIASVIKGVLTLEKGVIPPNVNFEHRNPAILEEWNLEFPTTPCPWPETAGGLRRMSINSFGFGGTNAHMVLDDAAHYLRSHRHARSDGCSSESSSQLGSFKDSGVASEVDSGTPAASPAKQAISQTVASLPQASSCIFVLSAQDQTGTTRMRDLYRAYAVSKRELGLSEEQESSLLRDLSYTLSSHRTHHDWRSFSIAQSMRDLCQSSDESVISGTSRIHSDPQLALVFTGQGAQWPAMGRGLFEYPVFKNSMLEADHYLSTLGCPWSLIDELLNTAELSHIDDPIYCQPICTALQVALVDLLESWGVVLCAVIGHSSGEIAAAYAAGRLSKHAAWKISYFRGYLSGQLCSSESQLKTTMAAVGLDMSQCARYIDKVQARELTPGGGLEVACMNSPQSHTISGTIAEIDSLVAMLQDEGIFARKLNVSIGYHSRFMVPVADEYATLIGDIEGRQTPVAVLPQFFSSTYGSSDFDLSELQQASYWVKNLVSPVRFNEAAAMMLKENATEMSSCGSTGSITDLLEIGPHGALRGPLNSIMKHQASEKPATYQSILTRNKSARETALESIAILFSRGHEIDLTTASQCGPERQSANMLTDLPPYPFNHTKQYWSESRLGRNFRCPSAGRHELLGRPLIDDMGPQAPKVWRNWIRISESPWLLDHKVDGEVLYPAAGMVAMAIEASRQVSGSDDRSALKALRMKDVSFHLACRIPDDSKSGVEAYFSLAPPRSSRLANRSGWREFQFLSREEDSSEWREHCRGFVQLEYDSAPTAVDNGLDAQLFQEAIRHEVNETRQLCVQKHTGREVYNALSLSGLEYGAAFKAIRQASTARPGGQTRVHALVDNAVSKLLPSMPHQYVQPHMIHPATLDGVIQASLVPLVLGPSAVKRPLVPTLLDELWIATSHHHDSYSVSGTTTMNDGQEAILDISALDDQSGEPMIKAVLRATPLPSQNPISDRGHQKPLAFKVEWKADPTFMGEKETTMFFDSPDLATAEESPATQKSAANITNDLELLCRLYLRELLFSTEQCSSASTAPHMQQYLSWAGDETSLLEDGAINLVMAVGRSLRDIVSGRKDALEVVFQDKLADDAYRHGFGADQIYARLCGYLDILAHKEPGLRIAEVGAGTGGTTAPVLESLSKGISGCCFSHYDFTDISPSFFEQAKEKFAGYPAHDRIGYRVLDIEKSCVDQGFELGSYDVVIAANVLHATRSIQATLGHVLPLLKPGGKLLLYEVSDPTALGPCFCFGIFPGWWLSHEPERSTSPLLSVDSWKSHLKLAGFSDQVDSFTWRQCSFIVATKPELPVLRDSTPIHIVINGSSEVQQSVAEHLPGCLGLELPVPILDISEVRRRDVSLGTCILPIELEQPVLRSMTQEQLDRIKYVLSHSSEVVWLSKQDTLDPDKALIHGFARVARSECPNLKFTTVSFDGSMDLEGVARTTAEIMSSARGGENSFQVTEDNTVMIPRITEAHDVDAYLKARVAKTDQHNTVTEPLGMHKKRPLALTIGTLGLLETLRFEDDPLAGVPLEPNEVEFEAMACGMNFKDLALALGKVHGDPFSGLEAAGIVTRAGPSSLFRAGDKVFGLAYAGGAIGGGFKTHVRGRDGFLARLPEDDEMSWAQAAGIPLVYATVYGCLCERDPIREGDSILIHVAAGGVGQAAIQIAQSFGAEIFATVGSVEKRDFLELTYGLARDHIFSSRDLTFKSQVLRKTGGRGVDIVLNSLAGEALKASWDCVAPFGRFIELGIGDIAANSQIGMANLSRHTRFESFDLAYLAKQTDPAIQQRTQRIFQGAMHLVLTRLQDVRGKMPVTVFPMSDVLGAFRHMQAAKHIGKLVLEPRDDQVVPVLPPKVSTPTWKLDAGASYVISGGLGGVGKAIAEWMVSRGARYLILLSRSGAEGHPESQSFVQSLEAQGVTVAAPPCDVSCHETLKSVIRCVQGSMVLKDNLFLDMSLEEWQAAIRPKVDGSWNLHHILGPLDFFVLLSSATGIIGHQEQSNYAAGNTFQDALARYRVSQGSHAVSLDLPAVADVGFVAERPEILGSLRSQGLDILPLAELLAVLDHYCDPSQRGLQAADCNVALRLALPQELEAEGIATPRCHKDPLFSHLTQLESTVITTKTQQVKQESRHCVLLASAASAKEAHKIALDAVLLKLARILSVEPEALDPSKPLHALGIDSLVSVELRSWLAKELGVQLTVLEMTSKSSVRHLAETAVARSQYTPNFQGE